MSNNLFEIWFTYARQQLDGVANACMYVNDAAGSSYTLVESSSEEFSHSKSVLDSVDAVVKRRKSVVSVMAVEQESSVANSRVATVTGIAAKNYLVASPMIINKQLVGVVCIEFFYDNNSPSRDYLAEVESSIFWLDSLSQLLSASSSKQAELALKITAVALSQEKSADAAMAVTSELASGLKCERVSIGYVDNKDIRLNTISNSANHETRQNIVKGIEAAMLEAVDQCETLVYPPDANSYYYTHEHESFVKQHSIEHICTVPLVVNDDVIGAVMYERQAEAGPFDEKIKELCEQLAALFAPILYFRRLNDRPVSSKIKDSMHGLFSGIFGSDLLGTKLVVTAVACTLIFAFFTPWNYKVSASAVLEGAIERVITSPESGFIKDASARPGDVVDAGATLATLDDRDLLLEKLKWSGKQKQISKEYREALATHDLSQIGILRAQLSQAEAQLEILDLKLNRTVITSPISAVVVSGDYTRSLGSPVERGQVMYKVSPLEDYRVVLHVDESDISEVTVGMQGELTLSAAAEETFDIEVIKITPVSVAESGTNYFQVEAALSESPDFLRPGMQGVGKIEVGERRMLWVWTHKMVDWIRLKLWSWW